jgi:hypothetical protein
MAKKLSPLGLNVTMFSKPQEGGRTKKVKVSLPNGTDVETQIVEIEAEGADWEWFVRSPDGCMASFRVQAKKLYHDIPNRQVQRDNQAENAASIRMRMWVWGCVERA